MLGGATEQKGGGAGGRGGGHGGEGGGGCGEGGGGCGGNGDGGGLEGRRRLTRRFTSWPVVWSTTYSYSAGSGGGVNAGGGSSGSGGGGCRGGASPGSSGGHAHKAGRAACLLWWLAMEVAVSTSEDRKMPTIQDATQPSAWRHRLARRSAPYRRAVDPAGDSCGRSMGRAPASSSEPFSEPASTGSIRRLINCVPPPQQDGTRATRISRCGGGWASRHGLVR